MPIWFFKINYNAVTVRAPSADRSAHQSLRIHQQWAVTPVSPVKTLFTPLKKQSHNELEEFYKA